MKQLLKCNSSQYFEAYIVRNIFIVSFFALTVIQTSGQGVKDSLAAPADHNAEALDDAGFYLSYNATKDMLIVPPGRGEMLVSGIRVFTQEGKLLLSKDITKPLNANELDVSDLEDGIYIVNIITTRQVLYKTSLVIKR